MFLRSWSSFLALQHQSIKFILAKRLLTHLPSIFINTAKMCFMQLLQGLFIATLVLSLITVIFV